jgi:hypothetical protein
MDRREFLFWMTIGGFTLVSTEKITANVATAKHFLTSNIPKNSVTFYISPEGNDTWSGRQLTPEPKTNNGPFATLKRARDAIRELKQQQGGQLAQPVTVFLRNGTYYLDEPLVIEPEDSGTEENPIIFAAFENEKPIISGGKRLKNWQKLNQTLWVTKLPDVKTGQWYFRQLRIENRWATRTRYPKFDPNYPLTGGWLHAQWNRKSWEKGVFNVGILLAHIGDQLEWNITLPSAGEYIVWLSYQAPNNLNDFAALGLKNHQSIVLKNLPATEDKYQWIQATTLQLGADNQTLLWKNLKEGSFYLDAICLTTDPNWNPQTDIRILNWTGRYELTDPKPGQHLLIIQAEACDDLAGQNISIPKPDIPGEFDQIKLKPSQFPHWKNWEGAEVHIFPAWGWVNTILPVEGVDQKHSILQVNSTQDIRPGNRFFIANVWEALNSPDEWYLDKNKGELIYWPAQSNFTDLEIVAPAIDQLIILQGDLNSQKFVEYIIFQGITFIDTSYTVFDHSSQENIASNSISKAHRNTRSNSDYTPADAAFWLVAARHCKVEQCHFTHLGGYAIQLEQQSSKNQIIGNTMTQLGQGGIILLGNTETQPTYNLIAANQIDDCGQIYKHVAGIYLTTGSHNSMIHNHIQKMPRYGISLKSYDEHNFSHNNLIEFN